MAAACLVLLVESSPAAIDAAARTPRAQQMGPPTFRVAVNYVEIPVIVADRGGKFVDGLQAGDFRVLEDGVQQPIEKFELVSIPERGGAGALPELDVASNAQPSDGRLYVLLLDDLHITPSSTTVVRSAARRFIETELQRGDLAAVVCSSGRAAASQDFTDKRSLLVAAIDRVMGVAVPSAGRSIAESPRGADEEATQRAYDRSRTPAAIRALALSLRAVSGRRKSLILFSEGLDRASDPVGAEADMADAVAAAVRASVSIYSVDPSGLRAAGDAAVGLFTADGGSRTDTDIVASELPARQESLRRLAADTGGFAVINTNDPRRAFDRIREDSSRYYLLGYYSPLKKEDGRFHRIDVRVSSPGLTVRASPGYRASHVKPVESREAVEGQAGPTVPAAVRDAIESPVAHSGVRFSIFAGALKRSGRRVSVLVALHLDSRDLRFTEAGGDHFGNVNYWIVAADGDGKTVDGVGRAATVPLKPRRFQEVEIYGLRIIERLELPPGRFRLHAAVEDGRTHRVGSAHYDVEVPDFRSPHLTMGALVLTSTLAGRVPGVPNSILRELMPVLPGPPSVTRRFRREEAIGLVAYLFGNPAAGRSLAIDTTVTNLASGTEAHAEHETRDSSVLGRGFPIERRLPPLNVPNGLYALTVSVSLAGQPDATVSRRVVFEIVE